MRWVQIIYGQMNHIVYWKPNLNDDSNRFSDAQLPSFKLHQCHNWQNHYRNTEYGEYALDYISGGYQEHHRCEGDSDDYALNSRYHKGPFAHHVLPALWRLHKRAHTSRSLIFLLFDEIYPFLILRHFQIKNIFVVHLPTHFHMHELYFEVICLKNISFWGHKFTFSGGGHPFFQQLLVLLLRGYRIRTVKSVLHMTFEIVWPAPKELTLVWFVFAHERRVPEGVTKLYKIILIGQRCWVKSFIELYFAYVFSYPRVVPLSVNWI